VTISPLKRSFVESDHEMAYSAFMGDSNENISSEWHSGVILVSELAVNRRAALSELGVDSLRAKTETISVWHTTYPEVSARSLSESLSTFPRMRVLIDSPTQVVSRTDTTCEASVTRIIHQYQYYIVTFILQCVRAREHNGQ